ncbi:MAG: hypothetical protein B6245_03485 [Desulfobacteraceae bacterium 4572_88]|nr:MAG: hypothetical protein B6245_03485 [Desulfobacteraceae bacterium 4572_88]RLC20434.1 MAG: hypothetical protein DRI57_04805 [Deltaproteobacteria bacterium]
MGFDKIEVLTRKTRQRHKQEENMNIHQLTNPDSPLPIADELTFLKQQTGQDEAAILVRALHVGLDLLCRQLAEQLFIDGSFSRDKAVDVLGADRISEIEYAQKTLTKDIAQGLEL